MTLKKIQRDSTTQHISTADPQLAHLFHSLNKKAANADHTAEEIQSHPLSEVLRVNPTQNLWSRFLLLTSPFLEFFLERFSLQLRFTRPRDRAIAS